MNSEPAVIELRLPTRLGFEKVAMSTAASVADLMGFSSDRIEDLKTAVSEACLNAMEHGNHMNEALAVVVTLACDESGLEVQVHDRGPGLRDGPLAPDVARKMSGKEPPRGMGIFLIRSIMDEVHYVTRPGGSFARLVIYLNGRSRSEHGLTNQIHG
jgi:serine/threonine-protein kinase RsbW